MPCTFYHWLLWCIAYRNGITELYIMEWQVNIHIEKIPEGFYLATSDNLQGLVAQGRTITETLEIARDVAKKLIEAQDGEKQVW